MASIVSKKWLSLLTLTLSLFVGCEAEPKVKDFAVVTYNVENLFDVDGIAMFRDYEQDADEDPEGYSRAKFLSKLQKIAEVLKTVNDGSGPEVILFQELEADFTPETTVEDFDAFLSNYVKTDLSKMLGAKLVEGYAGLPAAAWLLKALEDAGLSGYHVVSVPSRGMDSGVAHTNAIFSKFPILEVERHPLVQARDILEATLDVEGRPLKVYVNHWKSGASNPEREPVRVENAKVLRALLDAQLRENPQADIIVAGDLNSHYNHSILYSEIETGINDVLGSSGVEDFSDNDLYNLWFELAPEQRYSEVWRGRRGTLMHMLVTSGLYDDSGISYVDGSFEKLVLPGINADAIGRPLEWSFYGKSGGGASDHLPVMARFTLEPFEATSALSAGNDALKEELKLDYHEDGEKIVTEDGAFLSELKDEELGTYMGRMYQIEAVITQQKPLKLDVNGKEWPTYIPNKALRRTIETLEVGTEVELVAAMAYYRGRAQFVIEWLR